MVKNKTLQQKVHMLIEEDGISSLMKEISTESEVTKFPKTPSNLYCGKSK